MWPLRRTKFLVGGAFVFVLVVSWSEAGFADPGPQADPAPPAPVATLPHPPLFDIPDLHSVANPARPLLPASFLSHDGQWITVHYAPSARERLAPLLFKLEEMRAEVAEVTGQPALRDVEVRVARTGEEMAALAPEDPAPLPSLAAASYLNSRLIVMSVEHPVTGDTVDLEELLRHHLTHLALASPIAQNRLPHWFTEGLARQVAREHSWSLSRVLFSAALRGRLLPLGQLDVYDSSRPEGSLAAAQAVDFVTFLRQPTHALRLSQAMERVRLGDTLPMALAHGFIGGLAAVEPEWQKDVLRRSLVQAAWWFMAFPAAVVLLALGLRKLVGRRRSIPTDAPVADRRPRVPPLPEGGRVHIVLSRRERRMDKSWTDPEVPKVEHDGQWHTLH